MKWKYRIHLQSPLEGWENYSACGDQIESGRQKDYLTKEPSRVTCLNCLKMLET